MRARHSQGVGHEPSHGIDLAPMLDFVVNLLIFFIVTAVFLKEQGVAVSRPSSAAPQASSATAVEIAADGEIRFDTRTVDLRAVRANVERFRAENPSSGLVIVASGEASTGTLVAVMDQIHLGGVHDITFSTAHPLP